MIKKCVVLCAGRGSRFKEVGYEMPKPLIEIQGKPMIQWVYETLPPCDEYLFMFLKEHVEKYPLEDLITKMTGGKGKVITIDSITRGAAETALLAFSEKEAQTNLLSDLLIVNSDQYVQYDLMNFRTLQKAFQEGIIFTFKATDKKWSFAEYDHHKGELKRVAEKDPISDLATCGLYYFKSIADYIWAAKEMIRKDIRTNGEFYLCPVYNELIGIGYKIVPFNVDFMHGIGTPEDLNLFKDWLCL